MAKAYLGVRAHVEGYRWRHRQRQVRSVCDGVLNPRRNRRVQIPIAALAARGSVQQSFYDASSERIVWYRACRLAPQKPRNCATFL